MDKETESRINSIITEHGLLVNGGGALLAKVDKLIELLDKNIGFKLHFIEKKLEAIQETLNKQKA